MIVRNEERNLPRCLDSVRGLADQLIVVDTGSTDATPRIAADRGATVLPFDFSYVDFAAARNYALAQANGHWILMLDADDNGDPAAGAKVWKRSATPALTEVTEDITRHIGSRAGIL